MLQKLNISIIALEYYNYVSPLEDAQQNGCPEMDENNNKDSSK